MMMVMIAGAKRCGASSYISKISQKGGIAFQNIETFVQNIKIQFSQLRQNGYDTFYNWKHTVRKIHPAKLEEMECGTFWTPVWMLAIQWTINGWMDWAIDTMDLTLQSAQEYQDWRLF